MEQQHNSRWRKVGGLVATAVISGGAIVGTAAPANAATTAGFAGGILTVRGDSADNAFSISRNAAGDHPGERRRRRHRRRYPDSCQYDEDLGLRAGRQRRHHHRRGQRRAAAGRAVRGEGNDVLTGGSAADLLFGQGGNDTLLGKGGADQLFGGGGNDTITGGDADDQAFGQGGDDRMIWNPGDDTDLNEGAGGTDTVEVNGGNGAEQFTTTANGTRVRFDRINPAPFSIDIGTSENLTLNANGGDDTFSATGNLAALIKITVDGGTGNDTINGSNGIDILLGGDGNDFVDGNQGNDVAFLGAGDDTFGWDPGDGSDTIEGQDGVDTMLFNGANISERFEVSANGGRVRFTRDIANIVMDSNDLEKIDLNALGGADVLTVNDLSGTDLTRINSNLAASGGGDDAAADNVVVNATNGGDVVDAER